VRSLRSAPPSAAVSRPREARRCRIPRSSSGSGSGCGCAGPRLSCSQRYEPIRARRSATDPDIGMTDVTGRRGTAPGGVTPAGPGARGCAGSWSGPCSTRWWCRRGSGPGSSPTGGSRHPRNPRRLLPANSRLRTLERVAWADAKSGDLVSCERALGQVEDNFIHTKPEDDPDWVYWLNREEIDVMAGRCYTELKQPGRAEALLKNTTSSYDNALVRENSLYLSWLAEDYILLNEIDLAAEIATRVLELGSRADSARTDERLRHLARLLKRYKEVPSAADFLDRYKDPNLRFHSSMRA